MLLRILATSVLLAPPTASVAVRAQEIAPPPPVQKAVGAIQPPRVLHVEMPHATEEAARLRVEGSVLVEFWVETDGSTSNIRVVRGLGYGLDENAVASVRLYRFVPAQADGQPVRFRVLVNVDFHLLQPH